MLTVIHLPVNFHRVFNGNRKFTHRIERGEMNTTVTPICGNFIAGKVRHTKHKVHVCFNTQGQLMQYVIAQRNEGFAKLSRERKNKTKKNKQPAE